MLASAALFRAFFLSSLPSSPSSETFSKETVRKSTRDSVAYFTISESGEFDSADLDLDADEPQAYRIKFDEKKDNYTVFWNSVRVLIGSDTLYPRSYDVTQVTGILRKTKIISADIFNRKGSPKLKIGFEGRQSALFKPMIV